MDGLIKGVIEMDKYLEDKIKEYYDNLLNIEYQKLSVYFKEQDKLNYSQKNIKEELDLFYSIYPDFEEDLTNTKLKCKMSEDLIETVRNQVLIEKVLAQITKIKVDKHWIIGD